MAEHDCGPWSLRDFAREPCGQRFDGPVVYEITDERTGEVYIGSTIWFEQRMLGHCGVRPARTHTVYTVRVLEVLPVGTPRRALGLAEQRHLDAARAAGTIIQNRQRSVARNPTKPHASTPLAAGIELRPAGRRRA